MSVAEPRSPEPLGTPRQSGRAPWRPRLARRRRHARDDARERTASRVRVPLTADQRVRVVQRRRSVAARAFAAVAAVFGSAAAHGAIVGVGLITAALNLGASRAVDGPITFEVHEAEPPPPEPEQPKEEPEPEPEAAPTRTVQPQAAPPPPEPEAPEPETPTPEAPLRVVGLSLESTVEGGGGLAFAVGQTRMGETADRAADPTREPAPSAAPLAKRTAPPPTAAPAGNRAASRIPTAKVEYRMPKRKRPRVPAYPATLKSQGIEADVTVMVTLDDTGKVTAVKIISPAAYPEFNEAARAAALGEEFEPALRDGVAVAYTLSYTYRFRIEER